MPHAALPSDADVTNALTNMSPAVTLPAQFDVDSEVAAAIDEWDRRTGYRPFLQTSGAATQKFLDPPGPDRRGSYIGGSDVLFLPTGLISLTSVWNLYDPTVTPASFNLLTQNLDYWLGPTQAASAVPPEPYTRIKFSCAQRGRPGSIVVTGVWGYTSGNVPDDAWAAIRDMAAARCLETLREGQMLQAASLAELDERETFDPQILLKAACALKGRADRVLMRYRLLSF